MKIKFSPRTREIIEVEQINIQRAERMIALTESICMSKITEAKFQSELAKLDIECCEANLARLKQ